MKKRLLPLSILLLVALAAGCSAPKQEALSAEEEETVASLVGQAQADDGMVMEGINLYMHRPDQLQGVAVPPELWVQAESFTIGEDKVYAFTEAQAVLYGREEEDTITLHASRGIFKQDDYAKMDGDIRMTAGAMKLFLLDLQWDRPEDGAPGVVHSDQPVIIDDPDLQLTASSLRLFPDMKAFEMDNVSGVVRFGKDLS